MMTLKDNLQREQVRYVGVCGQMHGCVLWKVFSFNFLCSFVLFSMSCFYVQFIFLCYVSSSLYVIFILLLTMKCTNASYRMFLLSLVMPFFYLFFIDIMNNQATICCSKLWFQTDANSTGRDEADKLKVKYAKMEIISLTVRHMYWSFGIWKPTANQLLCRFPHWFLHFTPGRMPAVTQSS